MPAAPPVAFATLSNPLPSKPYILSIAPTTISPHLVLHHPSPDLTVADAQTLQAVDTLTGVHTGLVTAVRCEEGSIWSAAKDAQVVRWDERSRRAAATIKAFVRKPLPVTALAVTAAEHLVIGGTELVSSEAHILFWDTRNTKVPAYSHTSTHSDDITHLSILPATATWQGANPVTPLPHRLLLSASTDGLVALSDLRETDEDEAVHAEENWNQSIACAGTFLHKDKMRVWARSDMDNVATWSAGTNDEGELELQDHVDIESTQFKFKQFETPNVGPSIVHPAMQEKEYKPTLKSDYLIDVCPSLGVSKHGVPMVGVGTNDGDIVLQHKADAQQQYRPSAFFLSGPGPSRGHKDVVRCMYHAVADEALYTGSEDGVLSGWSLASLPSRLVVGDAEIDDDGGDGREDVRSEDEESEIVTEESSNDSDDDESDHSDNDMEVDDEGPRDGPVLGGGRDRKESRRDKRRGKRFEPYKP